MKHRELESVVRGVVASFVSRNNDVDGWWAVGLLLAAVDPTDPSLTIDLMTGDSAPDLSGDGSGLQFLAKTWAATFARLVESQGVRHAPTSALLRVLYVPMNLRKGELYGFRCEVDVRDHRGRQFLAVKGGFCRPHVTTSERQSAGPNRLARRYGLIAPT
jgi:hypothetical protein